MLKISKNISFFKAVKTNTKILHFLYIFKQKKERLLLLITKNTGDSEFSVHKTKIPTNIEK